MSMTRTTHINPFIMKAANEDGQINGSGVWDCSVKNTVLRVAGEGFTPTVGGLIGNFDSKGIVASCKTKNISCMSISTIAHKKYIDKFIQIDEMKEAEEKGLRIDKGNCGAVFGSKNSDTQIFDCTFSSFSRLDNSDERCDAEYIK